MSTKKTRVFFIEMMGVPGSYDASVYDHLEDNDNEGLWFIKRFGRPASMEIQTRNVCIGEALPANGEADGVVLAGSYNSVHDDTDWQQAVLKWFPILREMQIPLLGICGSHQLLGLYFGADIVPVEDGPCAGTFSTTLSTAGSSSPLMKSIASDDRFHYANSEQIATVPGGSTLLAYSDKVPVAALDFGGHWYSTQFHPEATAESLGTIWRKSAPELCRNYTDNDSGGQLVENFLDIVVGGV
jgi:GMP synthase (glutamine-hydrolysing)